MECQKGGLRALQLLLRAKHTLKGTVPSLRQPARHSPKPHKRQGFNRGTAHITLEHCARTSAQGGPRVQATAGHPFCTEIPMSNKFKGRQPPISAQAGPSATEPPEVSERGGGLVIPS